MHRPDLDPASFEPRLVTGVAIEANRVAARRHRRIFDRGAHMMAMLHKRAEDKLDYTIDLHHWLEPGEAVVAARAYALPNQLVVTKVEFAPRAVVVWAKAGLDGGRHVVSCFIETSWGKEKLIRFVLLTRGQAIPEPPDPDPDPETIYVSISDGVIVEDPDTQTIMVSISDGVIVTIPDPDPDPEEEVTVTPSTITFPTTEIGDEHDIDLTITNTGTVPVIISGFSATGAAFSAVIIP